MKSSPLSPHWPRVKPQTMGTSTNPMLKSCRVFMPDFEGISIARHNGSVCKIKQFMGIQWCTFCRKEGAIATNQYIGMGRKTSPYMCAQCVARASLPGSAAVPRCPKG